MSSLINQLESLHQNSLYQQIVDVITNLPKEAVTPEITGQLARAYNNLGGEENLNEAISLLNSVKGQIEDFKYYYRIGYSYLMLGDEENALDNLNKALELNPDDLDTVELLLYAENDPAKSLAHTKRLKGHLDDEEYYTRMGLYSAATGDQESAIENLEKAYEINPQSEDVINLLGMVKNPENFIDEDEDEYEGTEDDDDMTGNFIGSVLLKDDVLHRDEIIKSLSEDWGINFPDLGDDNSIIMDAPEDLKIIISLMPGKVPNGEAENFAQGNYMWPDAVEVVSSHETHIVVAILGDATPVEKSILFTKAVTACVKQENALAVYADGAVYQPEFYIDFAKMINDDQVPIYNLVWFGIYNDGEKAGVYTYGMRKFGKDEIEIIHPSDSIDLGEVRDFLIDISGYVIGSDAVLQHGETIGFTAEQKIAITKSEGILLSGETLKLDYLNQ